MLDAADELFVMAALDDVIEVFLIINKPAQDVVENVIGRQAVIIALVFAQFSSLAVS